MHTYHVTSPIVYVEHSSTGMQIAQIASGEVLDVPDVDRESGLVDVVYHGRNVSVLLQDLRSHAEQDA